MLGSFLFPVGTGAATPPPTTGQGGVRSVLPGWLGRMGNGEALAVPSITSVSEVRHNAPCTITGTNFGSTTGRIILGGIQQSIQSWSNTSIVFLVNRGTNRYGTIQLTLDLADLSASTGASVTLLPPTTQWAYTTITTPTQAQNRFTTTPVDISTGDMVAWNNTVQGYNVSDITVRTDGSFVVAEGIPYFSLEVHDGTSWGTPGTQSLYEITEPVASIKMNGSWRQLSSIGVNRNGTWSTPMAMLVKQAGTWKRVWPVDNPAPTGFINTPQDGQTYAVVQDISIRVTAYDDRGIDRVEIYVQKSGAANPTLLSTVYGMTWYPDRYSATLFINNPIVGGGGTFSTWAMIYDIEGAVTQTDAVSFTIVSNTPPTVTLDSIPGTVVGTVSISASASDSDGSVVSVEAIQEPYGWDGPTASLGVDTTSPYSWSWNTTGIPNGTYRISAKATDNLGAINYAAALTNVYNLANPVLTAYSPGVNVANRSIYWLCGTNQASGTLYWVVTPNATTPTVNQIIAGRDAANSVATESGHVQTTYVGNYPTPTYTDLIPTVTYYCYFVQVNEQNKVSNIVSRSATLPVSLQITLNKASVSGSGSLTGSYGLGENVSATTDTVIATVQGAVGTPTITWELVSGTSATPNGPLGGTNYTYSFTRTSFVLTTETNYETGVYRAVVTDQNNTIAYSNNLTVNTSHYYFNPDVEPP
jgi:hypothetical protein